MTRQRHCWQASPDYRVLRRLEGGLIPTTPPGAEVRRAVFMDTETTGTDVTEDEVVELSMIAFDYDPSGGAIHTVHEADAFSRLRDPGRPIPPEATRVNNITDDMVAGQTIAEEEVEAFLDGVGLVIAHSASFDRPMWRKPGLSSSASIGPVRLRM